MTITELGAIGEFVGSIAVLATLIYVGVQVRLTRTEAWRRAQVARAQGVRDIWLHRSQNPELLDAMIGAEEALGAVFLDNPFVRQLVEEGGLTRRQAYLLLCDQIVQWQNWVATIDDIESQSPASLARMNRAIEMFYGIGYARTFWERQRAANVEERAVAYIQDVLERR